MAIQFFIDLKGPLTEIKNAQGLVSRGGLQPAFRLMIQDYRQLMAQAYSTQRTPGYKWPPNSLRYRRYDKYKGNSPPGVRTGAVRAAHVLGRGPGAVEEVFDNGFIVGTSLRYANFSAAGPRKPVKGLRVNTFTSVYDKKRKQVRSRRIPVRDPLLALYTPATRAIRKRIRTKWEGYIVDALGNALTEETNVRVARPRRQRISRRRRR